MKNTFGSIETGIKLTICLLVTAFLGCQGPASREAAVKSDSAAANGSIVANPTAVSARSTAPVDTTSLKGDWFLQEIKGVSVVNLKTAFIRFDTAKSSFTGSTGCNTLKGLFWYSDSDTSLVFGDRFLATKASCPGNEEHSLIKSLMSTNHYILKNSELVLLTDEGKELSVWRRASTSQRTAKL